MNITTDQVKLLYSEAGKPLEYVDQKFSYDFEVEVTENVRDGMLDSLRRMGANFQLSEFQVNTDTDTDTDTDTETSPQYVLWIEISSDFRFQTPKTGI